MDVIVILLIFAELVIVTVFVVVFVMVVEIIKKKIFVFCYSSGRLLVSLLQKQLQD